MADVQRKDGLVGYDELVVMLQIGESKVREMAREGRIPGRVYLTRKHLFSVPILRDWIDQGCPPVDTFKRTRKFHDAGKTRRTRA